MKKLLVAVFTLSFSFILSGCDFFEGKGINDVWYDQEQASIVLSYDLPTPQEDEETGITPVWELQLEVKHEEETEWTYLTTLENYKEDNLYIPFTMDKYGNIEVRITVFHEGSEINSFGPFGMWIEEPQFIYHFDVWFDGWNGAVNVNYGLDYRNVDKIELQKSNDGGLNWTSEFSKEITADDYGQMTYYELEEGTFVYKLVAYLNGEVVEEVTSYNEIMVYFEKDKFVGEMELWYAEASFDIYSQSVYVWWDCKGEFDNTIIYKSIDNVNWEVVEELPYYVKSLSFTEDVEGIYFYKVELVKGEDTLSITTNELRVRQNAVLNDINGWYDYNQNSINLNWDFYSEEVEVVLIERAYFDMNFEVVGEFGNLKKMYTDTDLMPGSVTYRITVFDSEGNLLDQLLSPEFFIEEVNYLYNVWTWYNWDSEYIEIGVDYNYSDLYTLLIERQVNDSDFQVIENNGDNYFYDYISEEGTYTYRVSLIDVDGNVKEVKETVVYDVTLPSFIYHFDTWHNSNNGIVEFHFGLNSNVAQVVIYKSTDGGLNWESIITQNITVNDEGWVKDTTSYIEETEGEYVYKLVALNANGEIIDEETTYYELIINYDHLNLNGEINIYHVEAHFNIYDKFVYLYFGTSGTYDSHLIERSTDGINFEYVTEVSRLVTNYWFEEIEGEYFYRVSALDSEGNVLTSRTTDYKVRVKYDALIHHFYAWFNWNNEVEMNFEFVGDDVAIIEVTRTNLETNEVVSIGEYGPLKHYVTDVTTSGTYIYTLTLYDTDGNVLDQLDSNEITVYTD